MKKTYEDEMIGEHQVFHIAGMKKLKNGGEHEYHPIFYNENKNEYYYPCYDEFYFHLKWVKHNPDEGGDSQDEKRGTTPSKKVKITSKKTHIIY
jgi:hypothetical protein